VAVAVVVSGGGGGGSGGARWGRVMRVGRTRRSLFVLLFGCPEHSTAAPQHGLE
jgi:hypothetical protein